MDRGKRDVLGVLVDGVDMAGAVERVLDSARLRQPGAVTALAVHGIVEANHDPRLRVALNNFDLVLPDGQPVRWALNLLYGLDLPDKVPGPSLVDELLTRAADEGYAVHFHGSTPETLSRIGAELERRFGGRLAVTMAPSRFKRIDEAELDELVASINETGAQMCFVGLGCPRQERFVAAAASGLKMPAIAVGAAFDYLAGNINRAPHLVQRAGLEWLYRTAQEPKRLARRYLVTNSAFTVGVGRQWAGQRLLGHPVGRAADDLTPSAWSLVDA
jgi:N-acetylglucosaminyldiphosphoundecaprenol N-acetyl-beta-D-mannosaminyltransferase